MTKSAFLKALGSLFLIPFIRTTKTEIECLEGDYYAAVRALILYRDKKGLNPGVRIQATAYNGTKLTGVIAPYGEQWSECAYVTVPVLLDKSHSHSQPWSIFTLEIAG